MRVYDEDSRKLKATLKGGTGYGPKASAGHSNRIFSAKWHPTEADLLVSGGWDNTVQIWDARAGASVRSIYGPHLCGDSMSPSRSIKKRPSSSWFAFIPCSSWLISRSKKDPGTMLSV